MLGLSGVLAVLGLATAWSLRDDDDHPGAVVGRQAGAIVLEEPLPRDLQAYTGHGAWVDVFDYAPAYQAEGAEPPVTPAVVADMADRGVRTLFLQAARNDEGSPEMLVDRSLLAQFLIEAHRHGIRVVGWYLPRFAEVGVDLDHLLAVHEFSVAGHRFDGVAVDIEWTEDVPDHDLRSDRLVQLSQELRAVTGTDALGAIVLPPVQIEVVNTDYWPDFPWPALAPLYDAWLPMSYWTFRSEASGYQDGYTYNEESTRRMRANLDDPDAPVHAIGGIGDEATADDLTAFLRSLADTGAVGGSIYDWRTLAPEGRELLADGFRSGPAAALPPPPPP